MVKKHKCQQCGVYFDGGPRAYYCPSCRTERRREQNRAHKTRKRTGDIRPHGSVDICDSCGCEYTVTASLQRYCPKCQKPQHLENDRKGGLEYYHKNKNEINPKRNESRRLCARVCVWCGKEFACNNKSLTCSDECRRKIKNQKWMERYRKKQA